MEDKNCNCAGLGENHECDCDGCAHEHGIDTIKITMEDGEEIDCGVMGTFDVEEKEYIALMPLENDEEVLLFQYSENDGEFTLEPIESDEDFEKVSSVFYEIFNEEDYEYEEYEEEK